MMPRTHTLRPAIFLPLIASVLCCFVTPPAHPHVTTDDTADVIHDWLQRLEAFGMCGSVLVERGGDVIIADGFGIADEQIGQPITADTVFHLGSLGKQFTAAAILKLQMQEKLRVDDLIATHLDDVPEDKQSITIHHLLTHTAGLPYQPGLGDALDLPLQSAPGERFSYSNPGYALLARIIDRCSGMSMEQFFAEHLFGPADMTRTACIGASNVPVDDVARAYTDQTDQGRVSDWSVNRQYRGAGDVASSVRDLLKWEHALRSCTILDEASTEMFFAEHVRNPGSNVGYAYGWMTIETIRGTRLVMHAGNLGGFNSDYRRYLDEDLTIIFLSNRFNDGRSMRDAVMNNISMLINGGDVPQPPKVVAMADDTRDQLAGKWADENGGMYSITTRAADGGIDVRALQPEAMRALFAPGADAQQSELIEQCDAAATAVIVGAFADDDQPLREHIAPALPFAGAWQAIRQIARDVESSHGSMQACAALGSAVVGGGQSMRTVVRVTLEQETVLIQLTFGRAGILHVTRVDAPPARVFMPTGDRTFSAFDIFSGASHTLTMTGPDTLRLGEADDPDVRSLRRITT